MTKMTFAVVLFFSASAAHPQASTPTNEPDNPSNGVLEMTIAPIFPQVPGPHRPGEPLLRDDIWDGAVEVKLKNVSSVKLSWFEREWWAEYDLEVLDAEGAPAPLTDFGKRAIAARLASGPLKGFRQVSQIDLDPSKSFTSHLLVGTCFRLQRGQTYTVKIRRSPDPQVDRLGRPLTALCATITIKGGPGGTDAPVH